MNGQKELVRRLMLLAIGLTALLCASTARPGSVLPNAIGVLASVGPARRGLRIDPTEALRSE